jgi:hypothetical protein
MEVCHFDLIRSLSKNMHTFWSCVLTKKVHNFSLFFINFIIICVHNILQLKKTRVPQRHEIMVCMLVIYWHVSVSDWRTLCFKPSVSKKFRRYHLTKCFVIARIYPGLTRIFTFHVICEMSDVPASQMCQRVR